MNENKLDDISEEQYVIQNEDVNIDNWKYAEVNIDDEEDVEEIDSDSNDNETPNLIEVIESDSEDKECK